jgi:sugar/nucleoside kinase (ribokinase family)
MIQKFDVISIGSATIDIFVKSKDFIYDKKLLSLRSSSKNEIYQGLICSGGGATNSSVTFSRLGLKSACISLLGNSYLNEYIFDDLKKNKVYEKFISVDKSNITDFSVILVAPDGTRSILTHRGQSALEEKNFKWSQLKKSKWFYISSLEGNLDLLEKIIGFAREFKIKIALNPGKRELSKPKKLLPLVKMVDFLCLNQEETEILFGMSHFDDSLFNRIHELKIPYVTITNGRQGAYVLFDQKQFYSPAAQSKPIDETGAGDSFGATFVSALIYNKPPKDALYWAITNSASVVSHLGSKPGLLNLKQINSFIHKS